jgi:hypothetical protein
MVQMSILIYNWRDIKNPGAGGAEVFTHENAKRWVERVNKVMLFTSAFERLRKEEMIVDWVRAIRDSGRYSIYWKTVQEHIKLLCNVRKFGEIS